MDAFNDSQDRVVIKEEEMGGEGNHYQKLKVRAAANELPDMAFMQGSHDYVSFVTAGLLHPIDDMIEADPNFVRAERIPPVAESIFHVLGKTWGLPNEAAAFGMYYNKSMFDEAGVAYPEPGWTWDDFLEKALALTKGEGATKQYGFIQNYDAFRSMVWVRTNGGRYFDSDEFPQTISVDNAQVVEAIQFLQDLVWTHKVSVAEGQFAAASGGIGFDTGRVAMNMEGNWRIPGWVPKLQDLGMEWDVAPLPEQAAQTTWLSVDITPHLRHHRIPQRVLRVHQVLEQGRPALHAQPLGAPAGHPERGNKAALGRLDRRQRYRAAGRRRLLERLEFGLGDAVDTGLAGDQRRGAGTRLGGDFPGRGLRRRQRTRIGPAARASNPG